MRHRKKARRSWGRWVLIGFAGVVAVLLIVSVIASPIAKRVINRKLAAMPDYRGEVGTVNVAWWRGAAEIKDFVLHERVAENDLPPVRVKRAGMRIAYKELFRGKLLGRIELDGAEVNIVKRQPASGPIDAAQEVKEKVKEVKAESKTWQDALKTAFPLELTHLEAKDAKVRLVDRMHQPVVDVAVENLHVVATNLTNHPKEGDALPAKVEVTGVTTGNGKLRITAEVDPLALQPRFASTMEIRELSLPPINSLLLAYTDADVASGTFEFFLEVAAENGAYNGYVKPFLKDLDFSTPSDKDKKLGQKIKEKAADVVASVFKNDKEDKVATKAPFSGTFEGGKVEIWATIQNLLRNAFVQALREGFEGRPPTRSPGK